MKIIENLKYSLEFCSGVEEIIPSDYNKYNMGKNERNMYIIIAFVVVFLISYTFYHSIIISLVISPIALFFPGIKKKDFIKKRKEEVLFQFKDLLYSITSSLYVGKSIENAFKESISDLLIIYPDDEALIIRELKVISRKLEMNEPIIEVLDDFAKRSKLEDVESLVDVLKTCRSTGGDIIEVIKSSADIINEKIEVKNEIETMISEKKFEQKVMSLMPVALMLILTFTTYDYMEPIFTTNKGRVIMTFALIIISVGYYFSKKVMEIKV